MIWQVAMILSIIFGTMRVFLDKKLIEKISPLSLLFYTGLWATVFFILFFFIRHEGMPFLYLEMIGIGIVYMVAVLAYYKAIKVSLSQTMIFAPYSFVIPLILASVFLGEWKLLDPMTFSGLKTTAGIALALVSLWLMVAGGSKKEQKLEVSWVWLISVYIIFIGVGNYLSKAFLADHGVLEALISQQIGGVPMVLLLNILKRENLSFSIKNHLFMLIDGLVASFAVVFFFLSIKQGPVSLVFPIQTLLFAISTTLVGLYVFSEAEKFNREKLIGMGLGVVGVVLLVI